MVRIGQQRSLTWVAALLACSVLIPTAVSCGSSANSSADGAPTTSTVDAPVPGRVVTRLRAPDGANHVSVDFQNSQGGYVLQFYIGTDGPFTLAVGLEDQTSFERMRTAEIASGATATDVAGTPAYQRGCTAGGPPGTAPTGNASLHWTRGTVGVELSGAIDNDCAFDGPNASAIRQMAATVSEASQGDWYGID